MTNPVTMSAIEVADLLPHRYPMLLVDRVLSLVPYESIVATKCVSGMDPYFQGHFPGNPVMPGVLMIEGLAQTSALLSFKSLSLDGIHYEKLCVFSSLDDVRFRRKVLPGDVIHYHVKLKKFRGLFAWFDGKIFVDGEEAVSASWSAALAQPFYNKDKP